MVLRKYSEHEEQDGIYVYGLIYFHDDFPDGTRIKIKKISKQRFNGYLVLNDSIILE